MIRGGREASVLCTDALSYSAHTTGHVLARGNDFKVRDVDAGRGSAQMVDVTTLRGPFSVREEPSDAVSSNWSRRAVGYGSGTHPTVTMGVSASSPQPALIGSAYGDLRPKSFAELLGNGSFTHEGIVAKTTSLMARRSAG